MLLLLFSFFSFSSSVVSLLLFATSKSREELSNYADGVCLLIIYFDSDSRHVETSRCLIYLFINIRVLTISSRQNRMFLSDSLLLLLLKTSMKNSCLNANKVMLSLIASVGRLSLRTFVSCNQCSLSRRISLMLLHPPCSTDIYRVVE